MSNSAGQLNNNIHTVFTHLGLHFLTGGMEALKTIQIRAGNHTLSQKQCKWNSSWEEKKKVYFQVVEFK